MLNRKLLAGVLAVGAVLLSSARPALALSTLSGIVVANSAVPLGITPMNNTTHQVLKFTFKTSTTGVALELCAGTQANINAKTCPVRLGNANEVGITSLMIVDAANLNGDLIYVLSTNGTVTGSYTVTVE